MVQQQNITETRCFEQRHSSKGKWPPSRLVDAIRWFEEQYEAIPPLFRDTAELVFEVTTEWEDCYCFVIEITWKRPETAEEETERVKVEAINLAAREKTEREILAKLKAKYEQ